MVRIRRSVMLCEKTWTMSGEMENFSEWVRARLLANDEHEIERFVELLTKLSTQRLVCILLARLQDEERRGIDMNETKDNLMPALLAAALEGMN
jgi:hypothetical protein